MHSQGGKYPLSSGIILPPLTDVSERKELLLALLIAFNPTVNPFKNIYNLISVFFITDVHLGMESTLTASKATCCS